MRFSRFSEYLKELESTTKRLEITAILAKLIEELDQTETDKAIYLSLGQLGPLFAQIDFAIAEKMVVRILALAFEKMEAEINKLYEEEGDLGNVAEVLCKKSGNKDSKTTISEVFEDLKEIAEVGGAGSQEKKVQKFAELLKTVDSLSSRYLIRIPLGNIRLGFSEITVVEALSWLEKGNKSLKTDIEAYFHIYPDIGKIAKLFKKGGLKALEEVTLEVGVPILPQLCQRVATAEEAMEKLEGTAGSEYKFDGTRVQMHLDRKRFTKATTDQTTLFDSNSSIPFVKTFTRNLEETTNMFPDLVKAALNQVDAQSVILDGEAVGLDPKTGKLIPFQETSQRKRKHGIVGIISEIPLKYFVFDLLYLNGKSTLDLPLSKRRELLKKIIKKGETILVDDQAMVTKAKELRDNFNEAKEEGHEGLVLKRLDKPYEAGGRGFSWVKFKREETGDLSDTVDAVILGYYFGRGHRSQFGIGGFLVGIYDKEKDGFLTISKVGSGPTEEEWQKIKRRVDKIKVKEKPNNVFVTKTLMCDVWSKPEVVVVIRSDEITVSEAHTAGFALRFPRLIQFREDKRAEDSTSLIEIKHLYSLQKK